MKRLILSGLLLPVLLFAQKTDLPEELAGFQEPYSKADKYNDLSMQQMYVERKQHEDRLVQFIGVYSSRWNTFPNYLTRINFSARNHCGFTMYSRAYSSREGRSSIYVVGKKTNELETLLDNLRNDGPIRVYGKFRKTTFRSGSSRGNVVYVELHYLQFLGGKLAREAQAQLRSKLLAKYGKPYSKPSAYKKIPKFAVLVQSKEDYYRRKVCYQDTYHGLTELPYALRSDGMKESKYFCARIGEIRRYSRYGSSYYSSSTPSLPVVVRKRSEWGTMLKRLRPGETLQVYGRIRRSKGRYEKTYYIEPQYLQIIEAKPGKQAESPEGPQQKQILATFRQPYNDHKRYLKVTRQQVETTTESYARKRLYYDDVYIGFVEFPWQIKQSSLRAASYYAINVTDPAASYSRDPIIMVKKTAEFEKLFVALSIKTKVRVYAKMRTIKPKYGRELYYILELDYLQVLDQQPAEKAETTAQAAREKADALAPFRHPFGRHNQYKHAAYKVLTGDKAAYVKKPVYFDGKYHSLAKLSSNLKGAFSPKRYLAIKVDNYTTSYYDTYADLPIIIKKSAEWEKLFTALANNQKVRVYGELRSIRDRYKRRHHYFALHYLQVPEAEIAQARSTALQEKFSAPYEKWDQYKKVTFPMLNLSRGEYKDQMINYMGRCHGVIGAIPKAFKAAKLSDEKQLAVSISNDYNVPRKVDIHVIPVIADKNTELAELISDLDRYRQVRVYGQLLKLPEARRKPGAASQFYLKLHYLQVLAEEHSYRRGVREEVDPEQVKFLAAYKRPYAKHDSYRKTTYYTLRENRDKYRNKDVWYQGRFYGALPKFPELLKKSAYDAEKYFAVSVTSSGMPVLVPRTGDWAKLFGILKNYSEVRVYGRFRKLRRQRRTINFMQLHYLQIVEETRSSRSTEEEKETDPEQQKLLVKYTQPYAKQDSYRQTTYSTLWRNRESYRTKDLCYKGSFAGPMSEFPAILEKSIYRSRKFFAISVGSSRVPVLVRKDGDLAKLCNTLKKSSNTQVYGRFRKFRWKRRDVYFVELHYLQILPPEEREVRKEHVENEPDREEGAIFPIER